MDKNGELIAYWRRHVDAWRAGGGTQGAYCDQHGLKRHALSYWQLRLAKRDATAQAAPPLTLIPAAMRPAALAAPCLSLTSPSGWRLEWTALPPAGWLAELWGGRS